MNAAYLATDRSSGILTAADKAHQQLLQELQLQPTDDGAQANSRGHTFHSESQNDTHSRIDDFTLSKNLLAACKTTTTVLPAIDGSDHLPILANILMETITFIPPGPELPPPHRQSTLKLPLTKQQETSYQAGSEMKVGPRARQLTEEVTTQIIQADKLFEAATPEQRLRLNKKEMLAVAGVTVKHAVEYANRLTELVAESFVVAKEVCEWTKEGPVRPFHYKTRLEQRKNWNMITYRTTLRQACIQYKRKTAYSTDPEAWHHALRTTILELRNNAPAPYLERFPIQNTCRPMAHMVEGLGQSIY